MKVRRREATDVLTRDGETALLIDDTVLRLSDLSAAIYDLSENVIAMNRLARALETRFGAPATSTSLEATEQAVAELIRHGVLAQVP